MIKTMETPRVEFDKIIVDETRNVRTDYGSEAEWAEFVAQVRENGILEPFLVKELDDGAILLEHGYRRRRAANQIRQEAIKAKAKLVPFATVPVQFTPKGHSDEQTLIEHILRNAGKPLLAIERAADIYKLHTAFSLKVEEIAKRLGTTVQTVHADLKLLEADPTVKAMVRDGKIAATEVKRTTTAVGGSKEATKLIIAKAEEIAKQEAIDAGKDPEKIKVTAKHTQKATVLLAQSGVSLPVPQGRGRKKKKTSTAPTTPRWPSNLVEFTTQLAVIVRKADDDKELSKRLRHSDTGMLWPFRGTWFVRVDPKRLEAVKTGPVEEPDDE